MKTKDLTYIALMTAVLCILAPVSIPVPGSPVALTLATFALYLMAYILKPSHALTAVGIYLLLGAAGLPVFSGYLAGISRFAAPGGGYLIGYLFSAAISSLFIQKYTHTALQILGMLLGTLVMYGIGIFWLSYSTGASFFAVLPAGILVFLPLDLLKIILSSYIGRKLRLHIRK